MKACSNAASDFLEKRCSSGLVVEVDYGDYGQVYWVDVCFHYRREPLLVVLADVNGSCILQGAATTNQRLAFSALQGRPSQPKALQNTKGKTVLSEIRTIALPTVRVPEYRS